MSNQQRSYKGRDQRRDHYDQAFNIVIENVSDYNYLVTKAEEFGKRLKERNVKRSQFRRVFTHIKKIQANVESKKLDKTANIPGEILKEILLLKPKMAYTAGRHKSITDFYDVVVKFVNGMKTVTEFNRFYDFVEATLAYHRYHGGRD
ncbi:MAG: type III-A CRISPR-associated protein Csm2 [Candidatus Aminicenantes bacterium]|jgi:CRISPR-associated protein Csm2